MNRNNEEQAERRARKVRDIKTMFYGLLAAGTKTMQAYEKVAYHFYLSEKEIRDIIAGRR